jgi:hypothetical protein
MNITRKTLSQPVMSSTCPLCKVWQKTTCIGMYRNWGCCETRSQIGSSRHKFEGDMASLCSHGITSNLMSKRYGREPSTCAVREPESELISLQQWLDLSNINARARPSCHHFELASPVISFQTIDYSTPIKIFQTLLAYDEFQKTP